MTTLTPEVATAHTAGVPDPWTDYVPALLEQLDRTSGTVLRHVTGDRTGASLAHEIRSAATQLADLGAGPGVVVAVLTVPNDPSMLVARYAAHLLGATVVHVRSMNPRTDADELPVHAQAQVLHDTAAALLVLSLIHI